MPAKFTNNAFGTLASAISNTATTITLSSGNGSRFPALSAGEFFYATLVDSSNNLEIVQVTARATDSLTVVRGQDGTTGRSYSAGDRLELRPVAAALTNMLQKDGTNTFTGTLTSSGGTISGSWAGTSTFSGNVTFSNTITGSISGNAGTVTNGVYTTGDQNIAGSKRFSNTVAVGGTGTPASALDVQTTGANNIGAFFTTGVSDLNFRIGASNGTSGSTSGTTQGSVGLYYLGVGESAVIAFRRGSTTTDGSFAFRTSGNDRATLDNSGNFVVTGSLTSGAAINEKVFTITDGASVALNPANGTVQLWTLGASRTPTASSFADGQSMTLMIDDGAAYTVTWTTIGVTWKTNGGVAPTLNTSGYTVIVLWKVGTTVYGARVGDA